MAKHKYISCDIYKRGIHVFIGKPDEFKEWIANYFDEKEAEAFVKSTVSWIESGNIGEASFHYDNGIGSGVILIPCSPRTPSGHAILEHELLHATFFILNLCGVDYTYDGNNEAFTYLLEHLTRNALESKGYEEIKKMGKNEKRTSTEKRRGTA